MEKMEKQTFWTDFYLFKKEEISIKNEESLLKPIQIHSQKENQFKK